jgi:hypothetical protein
MNNTILEVHARELGIEGNVKYRVSIDYHDLRDILGNTPQDSFEFGDDDLNRNYLQRFIDGDLCSFLVEKWELVCEHCDIWSGIDHLGGVHANSAREALDYYIGAGE